MKISKYFSWVNSKLNVWSFWHLLGGVFLAKVFMWIGYDKAVVVAIVASLAILWEVIEYMIEQWHPYGSIKAWAEDTLMDLFLAIMVSIWIVL